VHTIVQEPALPNTTEEHASHRAQGHEVAVAVRNGLKLAGSLILTWSVAMIVKLQVPAHLGPVRQGHFGFAENFAALFFACTGLGFDTYVMKEVSVRAKHASEVVGGVFALRTIMSAVLLIAMIATLWITRRPREILLTAVVFGVSNLLIANNLTLGAVLQAGSRVGGIATSNVASKIVWGASLLLGLHFEAALPILAAALPLSELLKMVMLLPAAGREMGLRYRIDARATGKALVASMPYFVNSLALNILTSLGISVLEFVGHDEREVGWFAADLNLSNLCMLLSPLIGAVVMPMLSRAHARSESEGMDVLRRSLEGLIVLIAPITVLVSAGSDVLVHLAFGEKFAPAAPGLSILSLVFVMTYLDTMLAIALTIAGRGWSVTIVSVGSVFVNAAMMLVFVPAGRHLIGVGGECAGAATAVIATEVFVLVAMISRFDESPLDPRIVRVLLKSVAIGALVLLLDRQLRRIGSIRLAVDATIYVTMALLLRVVRIGELRNAFRAIRLRGPSIVPGIDR
jgi:O-antigen/teichoic acid export membrane protein